MLTYQDRIKHKMDRVKSNFHVELLLKKDEVCNEAAAKQ